MKYLFLSMFLITAIAAIAEPPAPGTPPQPAPTFTQPQQAPDTGGREPGERDWRAKTPEEIARLTKEAESFEARIKADPKDAELNIKLGFIYARLQKADDAQRAFENAVRLAPNRAISYYMLGLIYEKKGMKDKAVEAWKACLANADEQRQRDTAVKHLHHLTEGR